jgi:hypothetical protein
MPDHPDRIDPRSLGSIMATIRIVFEDAVVLEDEEGQVVIHTGLYSVGDPSTDLVDYDTAHIIP